MSNVLSEQDKVYLFSYEFHGSRWNLEIPAKSVAEAQLRLSKMAEAKLDGTVQLKIGIPAGPVSKLLTRLGL